VQTYIGIHNPITETRGQMPRELAKTKKGYQLKSARPLNNSRQQTCPNTTPTCKQRVPLKNLQLQVVPKLWISTAEDLYHHCQRLDMSRRRCTSHKIPFKVAGDIFQKKMHRMEI
jgi:hypothetical protein